MISIFDRKKFRGKKFACVLRGNKGEKIGVCYSMSEDSAIRYFKRVYKLYGEYDIDFFPIIKNGPHLGDRINRTLYINFYNTYLFTQTKPSNSTICKIP